MQSSGVNQRLYLQMQMQIWSIIVVSTLFRQSILPLLSCSAFTPLSYSERGRRRHGSQQDLIVQHALDDTAISTMQTDQVGVDQRSVDGIDTEYLVVNGREKLQHFFSFPLDDWQAHAGGAIIEGCNVIVCAPTGAGKTVVGEMALHFAFEQEKKTGIYTTPLKALSNQKYMELTAIFGKENTGLSTGDVSINKGARVTVMTTEVYRNIAWRSSSPSPYKQNNNNEIVRSSSNDLTENAVVVLDEFHYMGNPGRGGVWEESIITSPSHTQIIGLSATLSNAPALAAWMESVTGRKTILVDVPASKRPVPLRYLFATKDGLFPLFRDPNAGPGAPKGLLGYRGDGIAPKQQGGKKDKKKNSGGFGNYGDDSEEVTSNKKFPRGLLVNPVLKNEASRRLKKVDRAIERQKVRRQFQGDQNWDDFSPRRQVQQSARKMTAREERRERERLLRREMRRAVPSLHAIVNRLDQKDLLPAIFFIFSRAGCDEAARTVSNYMQGPRDPNTMLADELEDFAEKPIKVERKKKRKTRQRGKRQQDLVQDSDGRTFRSSSDFLDEAVLAASLYEGSGQLLDEEDFDSDSPLSSTNWKYYEKAGLLNYEEVREVASRITVFNKENDEIAFEDDIAEQFMFGVGSHHAGMLPAHKSFVEVLFQRQLMKIVFATETLAAGINMPARTTVICSMAKRGNGSTMALLETSNLLQMAGRAGRRGMDESGTCVLVATPFETHDDGAKILTDPIKPISSQFSPSYSLCINLIDRGQGKLDVAKQLVSKSFAMWEKRRLEEGIADAVGMHGESALEVMQGSAQEKFVKTVVFSLQKLVDERSSKFDISRIISLLDILKDREMLKKKSKSYIGAIKMFELEKTTQGYLERELFELRKVKIEPDEEELMDEDEQELLEELEIQKKRLSKTEREVNKHPFSMLTALINTIMMDEDSSEGAQLRRLLNASRGVDENAKFEILTAEELSSFSKSAIVMRRKTRKLSKSNPDLDPESLLVQAENADAIADDSWNDFVALTKTLVAYGCLSTHANLNDISDIEQEIFELTSAGNNLALLGFENSLWCLVAVGGAWDCAGVSSRLDDFRRAMENLDSDDNEDWYGESAALQSSESSEVIPKSQEEASELVSLLKSMSPSEIAGYVSCLISENSRGSGQSVVEMFQRATPLQQRVIQKSMLVLERLIEVQKHYGVEQETSLDIANCEVVTAWASGCSWNEALEISGSPPGDLARNLSRVLDAVRQLGNLPYSPVRRRDLDGVVEIENVSRGIDPEIRRLCRKASLAINRYPVKDPLAFESSDEEEDIDGETEDEIEDMNFEGTS